MAKKFNNKKFGTQRQYKIDITGEMLTSILLYSIREHELITKKSLSNLRKLLELIDEKDYETKNYDDFVNLRVTKLVLSLILDKKITTISLIKQHIFDEFAESMEGLKDLFENYLEVEELTSDEIAYINKFVEQRLTYSYMYKYRAEFKEIFNELDTSDNFESLNARFISTIERAFSDVKNAKADSECVINDFDMCDWTKSETVVKRTIEDLNKPNNKIKTGIKMLNNMLNGGLECGRLYLVCGVPKSFKSGTLLNICLWACKYNKNFILKDPKKKPTIFYLTQENSVKETIDRMYFHLTGKSIKEAKDEREAMEVISKGLGFENVNLIIRYRPNKSISTLDLDAMIDEIEADGNEVVLLVQDYTKRIRSSNYTSELRIELGNVSDDFCNIAKARNIPVVSGCQLNREAYKTIEMALAKGKKDIAKELNASHIGESAMLIENADYSFIINKEEVAEKSEEYLSFKLIATRVKSPEVTYFAQKFENGMRLEEDINLTKSLSVETIGENMKDFNPNAARERLQEKKSVSDIKKEAVVVSPVVPGAIDTPFEEVNLEDTTELLDF